MARVIDAILRITDEFSSPLQAFNAALTNVGRQGRQARKMIEDVGNNIAGFGTKLTAGVTVPLAGLATTSYSTFEGVDKQLSLVEATMGKEAYATADLSKALGDAAVNSIFSMEEGASALVNYARQGWDAAQSADMLAPALNLAAGTATDLSSVTSGLGNTLKAFGADSSEATKYVDMFTQAQAQANTDVQGLFDAMSIAGPTTKTVGWGFQDLATLVGVFGDNSISASEGATALNTGLMRLASPAKAGATALEKLGINAFDANGALLEMPDLIGELQKGFAGLSDQDALAAASNIFGKNQASKWVALINAADADALREMSNSIAGASGNAQTAADALVTPMEQLKSTFDVFKYTVGDTLSEVVVPLIDKATELVDKFRQMDPALQKNIVKFAGIAAAAGPFLMVFGKIVAFVPKVMAFGAAVGKAGGIAKFALAAITSPAGLVVAGLAAVVAAGVAIYKNWDTIKEKAQPLIQVFKDAGEQIAPHFDALKEAGSSLLETMQPLFDKISDIAEAVSGVLADAFKTVSGLMGDYFQLQISTIAELISDVLDTATALINFINDVFTKGWSTAWENIGKSFSDKFAPVLSGIQSALDGLKSLKDAAAEKWGNSKYNPSNWGDSVPGNASGTSYWSGGLTRVNESGGEIMNLPSGTQIIPHDASRNMKLGGGNITIPKLADQIIVRNDDDIDKITDQLVRKLMKAQNNMGAYSMA